MTKKIILEIEVNDCFRCPFLNSSDTGENCNILRKGIQEGEWSNINFQFDENWRYDKCPLFHEGYICKKCGVKVIDNLQKENEQIKQQLQSILKLTKKIEDCTHDIKLIGDFE